VGIHYAFKELDVPTLTTISSYITYVQFAIIPINSVNDNETNGHGLMEALGLSGISNLLLNPMNFLGTDIKIINPPMKTLLFATIVFGILDLFALSFFYPAWNIILFIMDLFGPGMFFFGCLILSSDYKGINKSAITALVIGLLWTLFRIVWYIYSIFRRRDKDWELKTSRQITAVFLARITHSLPDSEIDTRSASIKERVRIMDWSIPFKSTFKSKIIEIVSAVLLMIAEIIIIWGIGWRKMISPRYSGVQLKDIVSILEIISYIIFTATVVRVIFAGIDFIPRDNVKHVLLVGRRLFFKFLIFCSGVSLMPVLNFVLETTSIETVNCSLQNKTDEQHTTYSTNGTYYDFQLNASTFLKYFQEKEGVGCKNCTRFSHSQPNCSKYCFYGESLQYSVVKKAPYLDGNAVNKVYMVPIALLEVYLLAFFIQLERIIFTTALDCIENLPAPSTAIETKFTSVLNVLHACTVGRFTSYRFSQALYDFSFTQAKLFALFAAALLPIFPQEVVKESGDQIMPWMFVLVSLIITAVIGFTQPYKSKLHNITIGISYGISAIASIYCGLKKSNIIYTRSLATPLVILIIVVLPILTLILPFFLTVPKYDLPIPYSLKQITRAQKRIRHLRKRKRGQNVSSSDEEEDEEELKKTQKKNKKDDGELEDIEKNQEEEDIQYPSFPLRQLAPIHIERGIQSRKQTEDRFKKVARQIWVKWDLSNRDLAKATKEMAENADYLLDVSGFSGLIKLLDVSLLFSSGMLGWALGAGVADWKTGFYLRCDKPDASDDPWPIYTDR